jgi:hypothetical protein
MKKISIGIIAFAFIMVASAFLFNGCTKSQAHAVATWSNDLKQEYKVQDVNNRLYNYQWFYDQYQQCKATAANAKLLEGEEQKGTLMVLNSMIAEYNSKSSQVMNAALFKANDLPYRLDISDFGL